MITDTYPLLVSLLKADRSYRRFDENFTVDKALLEKLVSLVRYTSSGRNAQPLKYRLVWKREEREEVFPTLAWAGYFHDWEGPAKGERPGAYLVQCLDTRYGENCLCDDGLQIQAITLGATAKGLGCCIIKAFNAPALEKILDLPAHLKPRYVIALGKPAERVVIEDMPGEPDADFKYYRTPDGVHHVPKRPVSELTVGE